MLQSRHIQSLELQKKPGRQSLQKNFLFRMGSLPSAWSFRETAQLSKYSMQDFPSASGINPFLQDRHCSPFKSQPKQFLSIVLHRLEHPLVVSFQKYPSLHQGQMQQKSKIRLSSSHFDLIWYSSGPTSQLANRGTHDVPVGFGHPVEHCLQVASSLHIQQPAIMFVQFQHPDFQTGGLLETVSSHQPKK